MEENSPWGWSTYEDLRRAAYDKRQLRKTNISIKKAQPPSTTTTQPCPHSTKMCGSRIGIFSHLKTHKQDPPEEQSYSTRVIAGDDDDYNDGVCVSVCVCVKPCTVGLPVGLWGGRCQGKCKRWCRLWLQAEWHRGPAGPGAWHMGMWP